MRSASHPISYYDDRTSFRRRATSILLALIINALVALMMLTISAQRPSGSREGRGAIIVQLLPHASDTPTPTRAAAAHKRTRATSATRVRTPPAEPRRKPPPPVPDSPLHMLVISREMYAASDITKLPQHPPKPPAADRDALADASDSSSDGPGSGPHGERLYNAQWYREPTHAELSYYLPANRPTVGWGLIACRTIDHYHVDDCQEIADSPAGSGLAAAVREAAWQFLVLPPRIGGRPMVGAWVRIRIEFTQTGVK